MFNQGAIMAIHHPASTKNQNSRQFNLKRSMGPPATKGAASIAFEKTQTNIANNDNEVRSLDRIMDQNQGSTENSLGPKRSQFV